MNGVHKNEKRYFKYIECRTAVAKDVGLIDWKYCISSIFLLKSRLKLEKFQWKYIRTICESLDFSKEEQDGP